VFQGGERFRAEARYPSGSIITSERRQINTPDGRQVSGNLSFDLKRAAGSELHSPGLDCALVYANRLNEAGIEWHRCIGVNSHIACRT
jgi:hypothetical protein